MKYGVPGFLLVWILFSCGPGGAPVLEREDLFTLGLGTMEDEMDIFTRSDVASKEKNRFVLHDGRFSILNGQARKIMEFTSYGVLVTLHFNPETNPQPVALGLASDDGQLRNRKAVPYYFNSPGELSLNRRKQMWVEERIQEERRVYDPVLGGLLDRVILRFDTDGTFLDFLGQEGIGGTPFPFVTGLFVTQNDETVVVCRTQKLWALWWFDKSHNPVFQQQWSTDDIPLPADRKDVYSTCAQLIPDPTERRVYFDVSYYERTEDMATGAKTNISLYQNRILFYDLSKKDFFHSIIVPRYNRKKTAPDGTEVLIEYPYSLLGVSQGRKFFFNTPTDLGESRLLILEEDGKSHSERTLKILDSEQKIILYHLAPSGVLSALLSDGLQLKVVWWRSDKLVNIGNATPFISP